MIFLFKKKPVVLDLFTDRPEVYEYFQIQPATKFFPEWWKKLPKNIAGQNEYPKASMKTCRGFIDLYKNSFIQPLWCDLFIKLNGAPSYDYSWQFSDEKSEIIIHHKQEMGVDGPFFAPTYSHSKISNPWFIKSKDSVNFMLHDVTWDNKKDDYSLLPGVLNFKKTPVNLNLNYMFKQSQKEKTVLIEANTPISMLTPMTERSVVLKHHLVEKVEIEKLQNLHNLNISFLNKTKTVTKLKQNQKSKCPFGFGK